MTEKFELQLPRGVSDIPPEKKIFRDELVSKLKTIFEQFGFSPLETPTFERFDVLASKYAGGEEILKETFKFKDQGDRNLCLRYDLTVPFCRFIGMNKTLKMPFKRYAIGKVYRDGPIKAGRAREFYQCDVDVVGVKSMIADAECVEIAKRVFEEISLNIVIKVSNRKVLNGIMKYCGLKDEKSQIDAILSVDKLDKIGVEGVCKEMSDKGMGENLVNKIIEVISFKGDNRKKIEYLKKIINDVEGIEGISEMQQLLKFLEAEEDDTIVEFDLTLARGLAYYTSTVFEVFLKDKNKFSSSLGAGGRYDKMIGNFLQAKDEYSYPAVGISFGLEPICYVLESLNEEKIKNGEENQIKKTVTKLFIIPINTQIECLKIANELRREGLNVDLDLSGRSISKNLDYANVYNIPYVLFVGENELKLNKFKLKNMKSGEERMIELGDVKESIK